MKYINCIFRDYSNMFRCCRFFLKLTKVKEVKNKREPLMKFPFILFKDRIC